MRVLCISDEWGALTGNNLDSYPVCGETYTAVGEDEAFGLKFYLLAEFGDDNAFDKNLFIPAEETDRAIDTVNEVLLQPH